MYILFFEHQNLGAHADIPAWKSFWICQSPLFVPFCSFKVFSSLYDTNMLFFYLAVINNLVNWLTGIPFYRVNLLVLKDCSLFFFVCFVCWKYFTTGLILKSLGNIFVSFIYFSCGLLCWIFCWKCYDCNITFFSFSIFLIFWSVTLLCFFVIFCKCWFFYTMFT